MFNISYIAPDKQVDALNYLYEHKCARVLAGGTDLIAKWKKIGHPDMELLDIRNIEGFKEISAFEGWLFIGTAVTMDMVQYSDVIREKYPILAEAAGMVGSVQVRNMATIGGNSCNAAPSADTVLPLIVYDAEAVIVSKNAERRRPLKKFFLGPGKTILQQGELLKGFILPLPAPATYASFVKHSRRAGMDLATVGTAVKLSFEKGVIGDIKIALGAVGPVPIFIEALEQFIGLKLDGDAVERLARISEEQARPITDVRGSKEYRKDMVYEEVRSSLLKIAAAM
ncbi:FAD binding domain-containing protein [Synergistes jonesii]|uniref:FAD-binding PCMH-type domain-containing protein n=1 Tax=Synergistes jonesii TaxID=2754 RepID=A0A073IU28_9BACT|nr:xanthine dehydrogenase family protein subunit M [Synergistes jonesii]KEJ93055.1 hypothetical protein EH55_12165 [Synergistes jonesii]